jgi:hypothetical protein
MPQDSRDTVQEERDKNVHVGGGKTEAEFVAMRTSSPDSAERRLGQWTHRGSTGRTNAAYRRADGICRMRSERPFAFDRHPAARACLWVVVPERLMLGASVVPEGD